MLPTSKEFTYEIGWRRQQFRHITLAYQSEQLRVLLGADTMKRAAHASQQLIHLRQLVACRRLRAGVRRHFRSDEFSDRQLSAAFRKRNHVGDEVGGSIKVEVVISFFYGLQGRMRRTRVGRRGRPCEFIVAVENKLVHLCHMRRTWGIGGKSTPAQSRRRGVQRIERMRTYSA